MLKEKLELDERDKQRKQEMSKIIEERQARERNLAAQFAQVCLVLIECESDNCLLSASAVRFFVCFFVLSFLFMIADRAQVYVLLCAILCALAFEFVCVCVCTSTCTFGCTHVCDCTVCFSLYFVCLACQRRLLPILIRHHCDFLRFLTELECPD